MIAPQPLLLVIDDEPGMLALVERAVSATGFRVVSHTSAREALAMLPSEHADVALVDLQMPELGGLDVLREIRQVQPECGVILMTAHASVDSAIEAVKLGALDYLTKPLDFARLQELLTGARDEAARRAELFSAENTTAHRLELCGMIGRSGVMQQLFTLTRRVAPHARTALVTGETGAGKEGIARAIHVAGPRRSKKFVTVNCSAVVETLFESELFGHVRGAFTGATENKAGMFEAADGGTLFLDEIGELPPSVQAKLLRVLETGEVQRVGSIQARIVDVRIVAATNRDLRAEVEAGRFRSDLFYRLNIVELHVPPLRDRREDIPYLTVGVREGVLRAIRQADRRREPRRGADPDGGHLARQRAGAPQRARARVHALRRMDADRARRHARRCPRRGSSLPHLRRRAPRASTKSSAITSSACWPRCTGTSWPRPGVSASVAGRCIGGSSATA